MNLAPALCVSLAVLLPGCVFAQLVTFGVKGGVRSTDSIDADSSFRPEDRPYVVGPAVEVKLPAGFAAEANALYRRSGYSSFSIDIVGDRFTTRFRQNSLEFPLLVKYYLPGVPLVLRPFVSAGYSPRVKYGGEAYNLNVIVNLQGNVTSVSETRTRPASESDNGLVAAGGARLSAGPVKVSGEFRYTRWLSQSSMGLPRGGFFGPNANQAEVLFGLAF